MMRSTRSLLGTLTVAAFCCGCAQTDCIEGSEVWARSPTERFAVCGDLTIRGRNTGELAALQRLEGIEGSLVIEMNPDLSEVPELPALARIGGSLSISNNAALAHIHGFPALAELGGGVYIGENPVLTDLALGDALASADSLFIALNPRLRGFVCPLVTVEGDVVVSDNDDLEVLEMAALTEVAGNFDISYNESLRELQFPALRSVDGSWRVTGNLELATLAGFPVLAEARSLEVSFNPSLRAWDITGAFAACEGLGIEYNESLERIAGGAEVRLSATTRISVASNLGLQVVDGFDGVTAVEDLSMIGNKSLTGIPGFTRLAQVSELVVVGHTVLTGPAAWFPRLQQAEEVSIYRNPSLPPSRVDDLLGHLTVDGPIRVGDNMGESTALDPCPWPADGQCDAVDASGGGTRLCASDPEDCGV